MLTAGPGKGFTARGGPAAAIGRWADEDFPGEDPRAGRDITRYLVEYGYLLHRLFEIRPEYLE